MKPILLAIACLFASATATYAQEEHAPVPDYDFTGSEVIIGHGFLPSAQVFSGGDFAGNHYTNTQYTGALFATYRYHVSDVISLGLTFAFENEQGTFQDGNMYVLYSSSSYAPYNSFGKFRRSSYTFAPEITFNYGDFANGLVRLYSVIGMGYTYRNEIVQYNNVNTDYRSNVRPVHFNAYASPIGVRFGRQLGGFFELGLGYRGLLNYGLTYRF